MGMPKGETLRKEYVYDFAVNGGAVSAITLTPGDFSGALFPEGFVITGLSVDILTAFAGTATPTCTLGNTTDPDGYLVNFFGSAGSAQAIAPGQLDGALIWNTTNDCVLHYRISSTAADQNVIMTVGTQALTAGKARFTFFGYRAKA